METRKSDPSREIIPTLAKILDITETEIYRTKLLTADETLEERIAADVEDLRKATGSSIALVFGLSIMLSAFFTIFSVLWLVDVSFILQSKRIAWAVVMFMFLAAGAIVSFRAVKGSGTNR